jgi:hypothetical protein
MRVSSLLAPLNCTVLLPKGHFEWVALRFHTNSAAGPLYLPHESGWRYSGRTCGLLS